MYLNYTCSRNFEAIVEFTMKKFIGTLAEMLSLRNCSNITLSTLQVSAPCRAMKGDQNPCDRVNRQITTKDCMASYGNDVVCMKNIADTTFCGMYVKFLDIFTKWSESINQYGTAPIVIEHFSNCRLDKNLGNH